MIKLIVSDMDGTLLNSKHQISKENLKAIRRAEEMGICFAIATGRMYEDVEPLLKENDLKCQCIAMNGAEYRNEEAIILKSIDINKYKSIEILDCIKKYDLCVQIYTSEGLFTTSNEKEALMGMAYRLRAFEPKITMEKAIEMAKLESHFTRLKYVTHINDFLNSGIKIGKFIVFYDGIDILKKLKLDLEALGGLAISSSFSTNLEINNIDAQKGYILSKVIKEMKLEREEVMIIGDGLNDYSMFEQFTITFAMANARTKIKEVAKYITDTNDNAGVAKAIYKVLDQGIERIR